jgi:hypothetical protein
MDDDEIDVAFSLDIGDHRHESRSVAGLGGLGEIDILAHDHSAEFSGLALTCLTLGRNRVALVSVATIYLLVT